jgi:hypothetical protein
MDMIHEHPVFLTELNDITMLLTRFFVVVVPCISINIKVFCVQQMHTILTLIVSFNIFMLIMCAFVGHKKL